LGGKKRKKKKKGTFWGSRVTRTFKRGGRLTKKKQEILRDWEENCATRGTRKDGKED